MNKDIKKYKISQALLLFAGSVVILFSSALITWAENGKDSIPIPPITSNASAGHVPMQSGSQNEHRVENKSKDIIFNFDDADIFEVIKTFGDLLKINYVVDPSISGTVTIHIAKKLSQKDLLPIFLKILEINGLAAVQEDGVYQITTADNLPRKLLSKEKGVIKKDILLKGGMLIQIIPIKYIAAAEIEKIIQPFLSSAGSVFSHDSTNTLLVVDRLVNIDKILMLTDVFDVDIFKKLNFKMYKIANSDASDLVETLNEAFSMVSFKGKNEGLKFIAIEHLNAILAVSSKPDIFNSVDDFIKTIDTASPDIEPRIYVYFIQNGAAEDLHDLLEEIFNKTEKPEKDKQNKAAPKNQKPPQRKLKKISTEKAGTGSLKEEVTITADKIRNALIIEAIPSDYNIIETVLKKLDILPRQVLIECMIAEIQLDNNTEMGIDWTYTNTHGSYDSTLNITGGAAGIESGLKYTLEKVDRLNMAMHALANDGKVNILSTPSIIASDNKEASIEITTEEPISTAEYRYTDSSEPMVETSIEYRDTGIILKVTPHINKRGLVTMDIMQEVSEVKDSVEVGTEGSKYPSFFKRVAKTSITVQHKQTIAIGGLIRQKRERVRSGVPFLSQIPILGFIFGYSKDKINKTELIILLTPTVIINSEDVDIVADEFKKKLGKFQEELISKEP
ncbi:MAG: type II secretion system secretin GspD [Deltaproteobacteria bacterium]|nr:type II secretion system secretin GspD [Deltaproteobacteria bacterium]